MGDTLSLVAAVAIGYLLGTIPTGMVVGRARGVDLTTVGSRRTGATNVLRTLGTRWAVLVAIGDVLKGVLAALLAGVLTAGDPWGQVLASMAAVFGHTYSPFIGFHGGRGVLTGAGTALVIVPAAMLGGAAVGVATVWLTRFVSLGSILGAAATGVLTLVPVFLCGASPAYLLYGLVAPAFIIVAHRDNIQRLRAGTERRFGEPA